MLTGGIGFTYDLPNNPPLTQTNLADYPYNATTSQDRRSDRGRAQRRRRSRPAIPAAGRSSKTRAATSATRNSACSPRTLSTPDSATTPRPARGATGPTRTSSGWSADSEVLHPRDPRRRTSAACRSPGMRPTTYRQFLEDRVSGHAEELRDLPLARDAMTSARARRPVPCPIACTGRWRTGTYNAATDTCQVRVSPYVDTTATRRTTARASASTPPPVPPPLPRARPW